MNRNFVNQALNEGVIMQIRSMLTKNLFKTDCSLQFFVIIDNLRAMGSLCDPEGQGQSDKKTSDTNSVIIVDQKLYSGRSVLDPDFTNHSNEMAGQGKLESEEKTEQVLNDGNEENNPRRDDQMTLILQWQLKEKINNLKSQIINKKTCLEQRTIRVQNLQENIKLEPMNDTKRQLRITQKEVSILEQELSHLQQRRDVLSEAEEQASRIEEHGLTMVHLPRIVWQSD